MKIIGFQMFLSVQSSVTEIVLLIKTIETMKFFTMLFHFLMNIKITQIEEFLKIHT